MNNVKVSSVLYSQQQRIVHFSIKKIEQRGSWWVWKEQQCEGICWYSVKRENLKSFSLRVRKRNAGKKNVSSHRSTKCSLMRERHCKLYKWRQIKITKEYVSQSCCVICECAAQNPYNPLDFISTFYVHAWDLSAFHFQACICKLYKHVK